MIKYGHLEQAAHDHVHCDKSMTPKDTRVFSVRFVGKSKGILNPKMFLKLS